MEESNFFRFRKFYGQTQHQNFEQQNQRKSRHTKHPNAQALLETACTDPLEGLHTSGL